MGHQQSQISDVYSMKGNKKMINQSYQKGSNYAHAANQSPSPSQTFFKESKKGGGMGPANLMGKKVLPPFNKKN